MKTLIRSDEFHKDIIYTNKTNIMKRVKIIGTIALAMLLVASVPSVAQQEGGGNSRTKARSERPEGTPSSQKKNDNVRKSDNKKKERSSKSGNKTRKKDNNRPEATPPSDGRGQAPQDARPSNPPKDNGYGRGNDRRPDMNKPDEGNRPNGQRPDEGFRPENGQNPEMRRPDGQQADRRTPPPGAPRRRPNAGQPPRDRDGNARPPMPPQAPRQLEPIGYDRPARFWDRGLHYFGHRVYNLPQRAVQRSYFGIPYYVLDDIYYRYFDDGYYVSRPPYGVGFAEINREEAPYVCSFAYYTDSYYEFGTNNEFADAITKNNAFTVAANVTNAKDKGMTLDAYTALKACRLADDLGLVQSFGDLATDYYYTDGVFYTLSSDGRYYTVVPPAGALVYSLPDDSRMLMLNGEEYFAVDETVYRSANVAGQDCFEVIGQMTTGNNPIS